MLDTLKEVWAWVVAIFGGVSIAGILTAVIYGCLKGAFSKTISKINVEKISEDAVEKGIEKVKKISYTQSIEPLAKSELKKITEEANSYIKTEIEDLDKKYDKIIEILSNFAVYFDDSIAVSQDKKDALKASIASATQDKIETEQEIVIVEETNTKEETTSIER